MMGLCHWRHVEEHALRLLSVGETRCPCGWRARLLLI